MISYEVRMIYIHARLRLYHARLRYYHVHFNVTQLKTTLSFILNL